MDKITQILLIVVIILVVIWFSMSNILNLNLNLNLNYDSSIPSFNNENNNLSISDNNATIKLFGGTVLSKNEKLMVQLIDSNNQPIANKPISCRFFNSSSSYGNSYQSVTDENGFAYFSLDYVNPGFYGIEVEYKSYDDKIGSCIVKGNIEVRSY